MATVSSTSELSSYQCCCAVSAQGCHSRAISADSTSPAVSDQSHAVLCMLELVQPGPTWHRHPSTDTRARKTDLCTPCRSPTGARSRFGSSTTSLVARTSSTWLAGQACSNLTACKGSCLARLQRRLARLQRRTLGTCDLSDCLDGCPS